MLKKFDEFVNERLISDCEEKNNQRVKSNGLSDSDKEFFIDFIKKLGSVEYPMCWFSTSSRLFVLSFKDDNYAFYHQVKDENSEFFNHSDSKHRIGITNIENFLDKHPDFEVSLKKDFLIFPNEDTISKVKRNRFLIKSINNWLQKRFEDWCGIDKKKKNRGISIEFLIDIQDEIREELY